MLRFALIGLLAVPGAAVAQTPEADDPMTYAECIAQLDAILDRNTVSEAARTAARLGIAINAAGIAPDMIDTMAAASDAVSSADRQFVSAIALACEAIRESE